MSHSFTPYPYSAQSPHGQQPVARKDALTHLVQNSGTEEPRLTAFAGEMSMGTVERVPWLMGSLQSVASIVS